MSEATNQPTTPAPLGSRYIRVTTTTPITLRQPGPTRRSPHRVITGRLLGEMHARGAVHHYRVEGSDGVLYLAPPDWIAPASRVEVSNACITARLADPAPAGEVSPLMDVIMDIKALLDARDAARAAVAKPSAQVIKFTEKRAKEDDILPLMREVVGLLRERSHREGAPV